MTVRDIFNVLSPELVGRRLAVWLSDYDHRDDYIRFAGEIAESLDGHGESSLEVDSNGVLSVVGVDGSEDVFKLMSAQEVGDLDLGKTKGMPTAVKLLQDYSFFKLP